MKILPEELPDHIALQTNDTDKNYFYLIGKLRDRRSFLDEGNYDRVFKERGIFIINDFAEKIKRFFKKKEGLS